MNKVLVFTNNNQGFLSYLQSTTKLLDFDCEFCESELEVFERIIKNDISVLLIEDSKIEDLLSCIQRYLLLKPQLAILVLVDGDSYKLRIALLKTGVDRCLVKPIEYEEILENIYSVKRKQKINLFSSDDCSFPGWQLIKNHWILVAPNQK